jgi:broad specificity phosphatase PhoE
MASDTTIYLVRHGETDYNRDNIYQGTLDIPLNVTGHLQTLSLRARLSHVQFDAAYSSPLRRAMDTARTIVRELPVITIPELRELSYGSWQGLSRDARQRTDAEFDRRWRSHPWSVRFPNGESLQELHERVSASMTEIVHRHRGQTILVSGHGHVNRIALLFFTETDRNEFWNIDQPNGSCCRLTLTHDHDTQRVRYDYIT